MSLQFDVLGLVGAHVHKIIYTPRRKSGTFAAGAIYVLDDGKASVCIVSPDLGLGGLRIPTGKVDVTGVVVLSGGTYCLAPRGPADIVTAGRNIAEIVGLPQGTAATVGHGVVVSTVDLVADPLMKSFQVRDITRALTIYGTNTEIDSALAGIAGIGPGEIIAISGVTAERDGVHALVTGTIGGFAVSGRTSSAPLPTGALAISQAELGALRESQLVRLEGVRFDADGSFSVGGSYALADGPARVCIVSDALGLAGLAIPTGTVDLTGVVVQAGGEYCLAPRSPLDIVPPPSNVAEVAAMPLGTMATVGQVIVVSTADLVADPLMKSFQVRDITRALTIHGTNTEIEAALARIAGLGPDEVIAISGVTAERDGVHALVTGSVSGFAVSGRTSTAPVPTGALAASPSDVGTANESQLLRLHDVQLVNGGGTFAVGSSYALVGETTFVCVVSGELGGFPIPTGSVDIVGVVIRSGGSYCLAPRSPGDIVPPPSTIVDIAAMPLGTPATVGQAVIVSTTDLVAASGIRSFQIRDNTRALTIYGTDAEINAVLARFGVGSVVEISGLSGARDGVLVLVTGTVAGFAVTGRTSSAPIPTGALTVSPAEIGPSRESQLVTLPSAMFAEGGTFAAGSSYTLANGPASVCIVSDSLGLAGLPIPAVAIDLTGVVVQANGVYCLAPRHPGDVMPLVVAVPAMPAPMLGLLGLAMLGSATIVLRRKREARHHHAGL